LAQGLQNKKQIVIIFFIHIVGNKVIYYI